MFSNSPRESRPRWSTWASASRSPRSPSMPLQLEVFATSGAARRGRLVTPHGVIETPAFMPVGTLGAVKGVHPRELAAAGASVMLSNLYHLAPRPGSGHLDPPAGAHA